MRYIVLFKYLLRYLTQAADLKLSYEQRRAASRVQIGNCTSLAFERLSREQRNCILQHAFESKEILILTVEAKT